MRFYVREFTREAADPRKIWFKDTEVEAKDLRRAKALATSRAEFYSASVLLIGLTRQDCVCNPLTRRLPIYLKHQHGGWKDVPEIERERVAAKLSQINSGTLRDDYEDTVHVVNGKSMRLLCTSTMPRWAQLQDPSWRSGVVFDDYGQMQEYILQIQGKAIRKSLLTKISCRIPDRTREDSSAIRLLVDQALQQARWLADRTAYLDRRLEAIASRLAADYLVSTGRCERKDLDNPEYAIERFDSNGLNIVEVFRSGGIRSAKRRLAQFERKDPQHGYSLYQAVWVNPDEISFTHCFTQRNKESN